MEEGQFVSWRIEIQVNKLQVSKFGQRLQCIIAAFTNPYAVQVPQVLRERLQQLLSHRLLVQHQRTERFAISEI